MSERLTVRIVNSSFCFYAHYLGLVNCVIKLFFLILTLRLVVIRYLAACFDPSLSIRLFFKESEDAVSSHPSIVRA